MVTDVGDSYITTVTGRLTSEVSKHFVRLLQQEFGEKLAIVLVNAPYFIERSFKKQAAADGLLLVPTAVFAATDPVRTVWRQLQAKRANRLFRSINELTAYLDEVLPTLVSPRIYEYLC